MTDRLAARTGFTEAATMEAMGGVFAAIGNALTNGEEVRIAGFGTFRTRSRLAHAGGNPSPAGEDSISASTSPTFKAGKTLKDIVNVRQGS